MPEYHKSSYSGGRHENCVEVAEGPVTRVRDTQNRRLVLEVPAPEWARLLNSVKAGEL